MKSRGPQEYIADFKRTIEKSDRNTMSTTSIELESNVDEKQQSQHQQMLLLARSLDTIGRRTEQFLCQQLDQLKGAIDEFECEKAAWRRQFRRESHELAQQRKEIQQLREANSSGSHRAIDAARSSAHMQRDSAEVNARKSGTAPLRFLIQPGDASTMQVGLLMFEISKLNREMGGRGLRFELEDVHTPKKRLLARMTQSDCDGEIQELTAFPAIPLAGRGAHVAIDVEGTDRLEDWIMFKSRLLQSSLVNRDLARIFSNCKSVKHHRKSSSVVKEAARRAEGNGSGSNLESDYPSAALWASTSVNAIQQQMARLENCGERLALDCGLFIHVEIHSLPQAKSAKQT